MDPSQGGLPLYFQQAAGAPPTTMNPAIHQQNQPSAGAPSNTTMNPAISQQYQHWDGAPFTAMDLAIPQEYQHSAGTPFTTMNPAIPQQYQHSDNSPFTMMNPAVPQQYQHSFGAPFTMTSPAVPQQYQHSAGVPSMTMNPGIPQQYHSWKPAAPIELHQPWPIHPPARNVHPQLMQQSDTDQPWTMRPPVRTARPPLWPLDDTDHPRPGGSEWQQLNKRIGKLMCELHRLKGPGDIEVQWFDTDNFPVIQWTIHSAVVAKSKWLAELCDQAKLSFQRHFRIRCSYENIRQFEYLLIWLYTNKVSKTIHAIAARGGMQFMTVQRFYQYVATLWEDYGDCEPLKTDLSCILMAWANDRYVPFSTIEKRLGGWD